jgi:hypothetical protein
MKAACPLAPSKNNMIVRFGQPFYTNTLDFCKSSSVLKDICEGLREFIAI